MTVSYLYQGTWPCGCVYVGRSVKPYYRWRQHETCPNSWAIRDHMIQHGPPKWEIIGDEDGYPVSRIEDVEQARIDEALASGTKLLNRHGVDMGRATTGRGPLPGTKTFSSRKDRQRQRQRQRQRHYPVRSTAPHSCSICRRRLDASEFGTDTHRSSGLASKCHDCKRLFNRLYRTLGTSSKPYEALRKIVKEWRDAGMQGDHPGAKA